MQRSIPYQNLVSQLALVGLFTVYISLSSLYLLLPPLLALQFFAFKKSLQRNDLFALIIVSIMLLVFEAEKGFWFGSTIMFFSLVTHYAIPKIEQLVQCRICLAAIYTVFAYPGYWLFVWIANQVLLLNTPAIDWYMGLYVVVEFLILAAVI